MSRRTRRRLACLIALGLSLGLARGEARADGAAPVPSPWEPGIDLRVDLPFAAAAVAAWVVPSMLRDRIAPTSCGYCERDAGGVVALNPVDAGARRLLRLANPGGAMLASDLVTYAALPVAAIALDVALSPKGRRGRAVLTDALIALESVAVASALTHVVKVAAARERPFHAAPGGREADLLDGKPDAEAYLSFPSGHTSFAFALATAAGTLASLRGSRLAPLVWALGMSLATTTAVLRIAADRHYLTDVAAGATLGAAVGAAVPLLHALPPSWGPRIPALSGRADARSAAISATWIF